jgi:hypothetical protein
MGIEIVDLVSLPSFPELCHLKSPPFGTAIAVFSNREFLRRPSFSVWPGIPPVPPFFCLPLAGSQKSCFGTASQGSPWPLKFISILTSK